MKNPNPVNLQTSASIRKAGWQAETRDADGHLCRTHAPFETDEEIVWLVREALEHGETVTIWPNVAPPAQTQPVEAQEPVAWIANCCHCGRIVDTREKEDGGDDFGAELSDGRWTCSVECWDAVAEPGFVTPKAVGDEARDLINDWIAEGAEDLPGDTPVTIRIGERSIILDTLACLRTAALHGSEKGEA